MATPPPEGTTAVLKADKPLLPPAVTDLPADSPINRYGDPLFPSSSMLLSLVFNEHSICFEVVRQLMLTLKLKIT